jgi:hypothetical protein
LVSSRNNLDFHGMLMHLSQRRRKRIQAGWLVAVVAVLSGCGGGGGDSSSNSQPATSPTVPPANTAPTIQGQPSTQVVVGQSYSFQPAAADANGDALTFSITNLPRWATFSSTTGRISGTPTSADVGSYASIAISVSDGTASASLAAFTIMVTDVATGSATLSWELPVQNTDGSALTNLAGFNVLYGRSASSLDQTVQLTNPSLNRYVLESLASGTWYFAVVAVNAAGVASAPSNVGSKTIG